MSVTDSIKAMPTIAALMILLCGCGAHKPYRPIVTAPAVWIDAADSEDELNKEFAAGHWSCPTGYQFLGKRWDMGVHTASAVCWKHR